MLQQQHYSMTHGNLNTTQNSTVLIPLPRIPVNTFIVYNSEIINAVSLQAININTKLNPSALEINFIKLRNEDDGDLINKKMT